MVKRLACIRKDRNGVNFEWLSPSDIHVHRNGNNQIKQIMRYILLTGMERRDKIVTHRKNRR